MPRHFFRSSWLQILIHSTCGIALALLLWSSGLLQGIESKTYDFRAQHGARPERASNSIVMVFLDQGSIDWVAENMGIVWPWPRELFAAILTNCLRRGAKAVGFDVLFTESSAAGVPDDEALARAIRQTTNFSLGSVFPTVNKTPLTRWPESIPPPRFKFTVVNDAPLAFPSYEFATFPIDVVGRETPILANVNLRPDPDGIYRRIHPFILFDGKPLPNLGIGLYLAANPDATVEISTRQVRIGNRTIPVDDDGNSILKFRGPSGTYPSYSAASLIRQEFQLMNGELEPDAIVPDMEGKYVLFGFTAPGLFDLRPTPTDGIYSGVEINATSLDNLLTDDFIRPPAPVPMMVLIIIILTLLCVFPVSYLRSFRNKIPVAVLVLCVPMALSWYLYQKGIDMRLVPLQIAITTGVTVSILHGYFTVLGQERFIRHSFKHYLSPHVIDDLISDPGRLKLGGERKELTMLFSDLKGFTSISEGLEPAELIQLLNEYLTAMTDIILAEEGTVDKFVGDAIIAFWNAPLDIPDHAERAVRAALRCQEQLASMRPYFFKRYNKTLIMRIGINTGYVIAGNMGSSSRFDYTILGDAANLAARLEGANKFFGTETMISAATYHQLDSTTFYCRELGRLKVVGRDRPVTVYEPITYGQRGTIPDHASFAEGLNYFYAGDFSGAYFAFARTADQDPAAENYCTLCKRLMEKKPERWAGVCELASK